MSARVENESINNVLETAVDIIRKYRTLFNKILGLTPEEVKETHEALEGFTPAEIREALKLYREKHK
jgi:Mn-dependent DtxR family transcriptional regulator